MRKPFYEKMWVVILIGDDGELYTPFNYTRKEAIFDHVAWGGMSQIEIRKRWKDAYRRGFRCIQVEIKEIQKVKK